MSTSDMIDPPEEPTPPKWWREYVMACFTIGSDPMQVDFSDEGRETAIKDMESIESAAKYALEVM